MVGVAGGAGAGADGSVGLVFCVVPELRFSLSSFDVEVLLFFFLLDADGLTSPSRGESGGALLHATRANAMNVIAMRERLISMNVHAALAEPRDRRCKITPYVGLDQP